MKLPSEWEMKTLGELGTCHIGLTYKPDNVVSEGGTLVLRSSNIQQSRLVFDDNVFVNMDVPSKLKVCYGDILICVRNGSRSLIGKSAVIEQEHAIENLTFGAFMSVYRTDHHDYVRHLFHSDMYYRQIRNNLGATINQITNKNLNNFTFPFPKSSAERNKIAEILSTVDKKIDLIDQKIAETEKLKTGLMQKLFSEGIGVQDENGEWQPHTEFQNSPFGKIPRAWKYAPVKSLVSIKSPKYDPKIKTESLPCIELAHLSQGSGEILGTVNSLELASTKNCFAKGDVLFGKLRPYLKKFAKPNFNGVCSSEIWVMKTTDNKVLHNDFWFYFIQSERFINEANKSCGTKMPRADWKVVSELILPIPSFCEQLGIAKILECVDAKLGLLKQQKAETQQLKKGLMQKLLTGEWRVPVEETEAA
ncbi:restriction endonuclease subunit S [Vibrio parahaemolyticus]|uniref:restriction endonuclease subunit S n=1 Tax=Vibrio parahaemolyticus TaxID=670 RepID=UPI001331A6C5|nr:restriction endonuclease subunit S [Vibrio parahaemolyticus]HAS6229778.1 restriction endonuclease subunit S [Vibrio vulnificus]